jgi:transporter family protein
MDRGDYNRVRHVARTAAIGVNVVPAISTRGLAQDDIESPPFHSIERCYLRFISRGILDQDGTIRRTGMAWLSWALLAAFAAAATAILAKIGVRGVPSTTATAIRTVVVLVAAWALVFLLGEQRTIPQIPRRSLLFLVLSGLATGVSWLAYFRALQMAPASLVSPIDKLSLPLTIVLAALWLREPVNWQVGAGVTLMTLGALVIWYWSPAS